MDSFTLQTKIVYHGGLDPVLGRMKKVFLVTDPFMAKSGKTSYVTDKLDHAGITYEIFSDCSADPDIEVVLAGVKEVLAFQPDTIIALGGGSPIDAAKAMLHVAGNAGMARPFFVIIPTTSGTGSEVTNFSVITDREKAVKYPIITDNMLADVAILDAELTFSVPPSVTADTGIDVMTHAIEAFVCTQHNDFSDAVAEKAIKLVKHYLLTAYKEPENMEARQRMCNASCLAGIAFNNSGLGLNHGMSHALGARFHIPHGRANGVLMPYVMSFNAGCASKLTETAVRYAKISRLLEIDTASERQSALSLIRMVRRYLHQLNMPATLEEAGIKKAEFEEALPTMAQAALDDRCTATNPRPCTAEEIAEVFRQAYSGKIS